MLNRVIHLHLLSLLHQVHLLRIIGHKTLREFSHKGRRRPIFCGHQMLSKNYLDLAQLLLDVRLIDLHLLHHGSLRHGQRHCRPRVQGDPLQRRPQDDGHLKGSLAFTKNGLRAVVLLRLFGPGDDLVVGGWSHVGAGLLPRTRASFLPKEHKY